MLLKPHFSEKKILPVWGPFWTSTCFPKASQTLPKIFFNATKIEHLNNNKQMGSQDRPQVLPQAFENHICIEKYHFALLGPFLDAKMLPTTSPRHSQDFPKCIQNWWKNHVEQKSCFWSLFELLFIDFRFQNPLIFGSNLDAFCDHVQNCQDQQNIALAHEFLRSALKK